jgi:hypothetical protein
MTLGDQATRGVDDPLTSISNIPTINQLTGLADLGQTEGLVGDQLVRREAIMELDYLKIGGLGVALLVNILSGGASHIESDHLDVGVLEGGRQIGLKRLANNLDSLTLKAMLDNKLLATEDSTASTFRL